MGPWIDPRVAVVFKRLLATEENAPLAVHLLNSVLGVPRSVTGVDVLPPESERAAEQHKQVAADVRLRDQGGRQFHLEMQRRWSWALPERLLLGWALFHPTQLWKGERYETIRPTLAICILDDEIRHPLLSGARSPRLEFRLRETTRGIELVDDLMVVVLVLPWFEKGPDELETDLDRWLFFLRHAAKLDPENLPPRLDVEPIRKAFEVLVMFNSNPNLRAFYDAETSARLLRASELDETEQRGELRGEQRGELIGCIQLCQQVLGLPEAPKSELVSLPPAELEALHAQLVNQIALRRLSRGGLPPIRLVHGNPNPLRNSLANPKLHLEPPERTQSA